MGSSGCGWKISNLNLDSAVLEKHEKNRLLTEMMLGCVYASSWFKSYQNTLNI